MSRKPKPSTDVEAPDLDETPSMQDAGPVVAELTDELRHAIARVVVIESIKTAHDTANAAFNALVSQRAGRIEAMRNELSEAELKVNTLCVMYTEAGPELRKLQAFIDRSTKYGI